MGNYGSKDDGHNAIPEEDIIPSRSIRPPPAPEPSASSTPTQRTTTTISTNEEQSLQPIIPETTTDVVPTVFKWEHGGRNVYITGTFNNWERQIPMHRSGNDFTYVHNLKRGKHAFKFIVDDEWRYAPDQPTIADVEGRINNFIDVSDFVPYTGDDTFFLKSKERKILEDEFKQNIPDLDDYTKE
jgi:hypothetical protein